MIGHLLLVQDRGRHQVVGGSTVGVVVAYTDHDIVDVFGYQLTAVTTPNLALEKEFTEAIELNDVAPLVIFLQLNDRNVDHAAIHKTRVSWLSPRAMSFEGFQVCVVVNVLVDG